MKYNCPRCGTQDLNRSMNTVYSCNGCWTPIMDDIYPEIMNILNEAYYNIDDKKLSEKIGWVKNWIETLNT